MRATSCRRVFSPLAPVFTMMRPNSSGDTKRPLALICISKACGRLTGCWPTAPAATCTFCSRMAATTSLAVRLRAAILLGSSHTRMAYSPEPNTSTLPAPGMRASTSLTCNVAKLRKYTSSYRPLGEKRCTTMVRSGDCLTVVTPRRRTCSGSLGNACDTRFCTCTWALSTSVPRRNVTVTVSTPSPVAWEKT